MSNHHNATTNIIYPANHQRYIKTTKTQSYDATCYITSEVNIYEQDSAIITLQNTVCML